MGGPQLATGGSAIESLPPTGPSFASDGPSLVSGRPKTCFGQAWDLHRACLELVSDGPDLVMDMPQLAMY